MNNKASTLSFRSIGHRRKKDTGHGLTADYCGVQKTSAASRNWRKSRNLDFHNFPNGFRNQFPLMILSGNRAATAMSSSFVKKQPPVSELCI